MGGGGVQGLKKAAGWLDPPGGGVEFSQATPCTGTGWGDFDWAQTNSHGVVLFHLCTTLPKTTTKKMPHQKKTWCKFANLLLLHFDLPWHMALSAKQETLFLGTQKKDDF